MNNKLKNSSRLCLVALLLFTGCSKDEVEKEIKGDPSLSFVANTVPQEVPAEGGVVSLDVQWAYTVWNVKTGETVEGQEFITHIAPSYAGSGEEGSTQTTINLSVKNNETYSANSQRLIVRSVSEDLSDTIIIRQAGKAVEPLTMTLDPETTYQTIAGFGGAAIWHSLPLSNDHIQTLLGMGDNELGLSIVRVRISPVSDQWSADVSMLQEMESYDVQLMASPWSPPGEWKYDTQQDPLINGYLMEEHYADYANYLNDYVKFMAGENIVIDVVSIQNEPDWPASYESCEWTPQMMVNFVKDHGHLIDAKVLAAESLRFAENYTNGMLNDPLAAANLDIVGGHLYGNRKPTPYPLAEEKGKEIWMTEYLLNTPASDEVAQPATWATLSQKVIWDESIEMLEGIHECMVSNWNAYIYWYMKRYYSFLGDGSGGTVQGEILKRGFAFSHYSKYVRPGYVRIDARLDKAAEELKASAYMGDDKVVAVIINSGNSPIPELNLTIPQAVASAELYTTSESEDRTEQALTPADNKVTVSLPSRSITTVVMHY